MAPARLNTALPNRKLVPDPGEMMGGERTVLIDEESPAWLVRKDDIARTPPGQPVKAKSFTIAPPTAHFCAQYDDSDGIRVIFENMDLEDLAIYHKPGDVNMLGDEIEECHLGFFNMAMAPSSSPLSNFSATMRTSA